MSAKAVSSAIGINLFAIVLGIIFGDFLGPRASGLAFLGWFPVAIMKGLASPLLFLAILHGMMSDEISGRGARRLFMTCGINALAAMSIAMLLVDLLKPGLSLTQLVQGVMNHSSGLTGAPIKQVTWYEALKSLIPESVLGPFVNNNVPAILVLALLFGFAVRRAGLSETVPQAWFLRLRDVVQVALSIVAQMMMVLMTIMPIAIFAAVAKATGEHGVGVFKGLGYYVVICIGGMILQIAIIYQGWIRLWAGRSLMQFWRAARRPVVFAFGVNSSLATLPATLAALSDLNVKPGSSRLGACIGTNFNNDGILLYEVAAVMMLAQAAGLDWSIGHQLWIAMVCVLATFGVGGFPEAGIIALALVLSTAGLPAEILPLLLPVDWVVARMRSATNVVSDMTVSLVIDADSQKST
jgi:DAACS family dicarboxylate/amino acid:cation (Na+ or H+) symporter